MRVLPDFRREIDVAAVAATELSTSNKLLPPRWPDLALVGSEELVAGWLNSLMRHQLQFEHEEVLLARKLGRGARPVAILGLKERLLYRGAVTLIEARAGAPDRSQDAYDAFQRAPLGSQDCAYVLKADIAAYYQYVDHERLVDEVIAQTGDDLAITFAVELLHEVTARRFGLPQLNTASDVLGDIYIDPMRRSLARSGLPVWRFADDFRIACRDYGEALAALEATDQAARELGLVLNEVKTSTPSRDHYEASITAARDRERRLFAELDIEELEEPERGDYTDVGWNDEPLSTDSLLDEDDFDEDEAGPSSDDHLAEAVSRTQLAAATKVVELWVEEEEDDDVQRGEPARITSRLLGRALRVFAAAGDPSALVHTAAMLVYEPSLTPTIARYLRECGQVARRDARRTLDDVCRSGIVSAWQAVWIAYVAGELPRRRGGENLPHVDWLRAQLRSDHAALAAEALLALARRKLITTQTVLEVMSGLPAIHRTAALLALAALGDESTAMNAADSELERITIRWGLEQL